MISFLVDVFFLFYFRLVTFAFWAYNTLLKKKQVVSPPKDPLILKSATTLGREIRQRKVKSIDVIEAYIKRIEEVNVILNCVTLKLYDEARNEAKKVDAEIAAMSDIDLEQTAETRPLLGLPFTMKDALSVKGKVITSGMYSRRNTVTEETAPVVQRMFDAGGILLAITTVPESCMWVETNTPLWGCTRNPYDSRRIVGGSSGGEGALLGAAGSLMGIGSDIGGSIRIPSFMNGIFGLMGTPGAVPLDLHIPGGTKGNYKEEMARIGPMSRFCEDLEMLFNVMSGQKMQRKVSLDKAKFFSAEGLTHYKRIEPLSKETKEAMYLAVDHFEKKFGKSVQGIALPETENIFQVYIGSFNDETEDPALKEPLVDLPPPIVMFFEFFKALFGLSQYSIPLFVLGFFINPASYPKERRTKLAVTRDKLKKRLAELLGNDGLLLYPSWPTLPQFHSETIPKVTSFMNTGLFNLMGMPAVQCPVGLTNGLPNGVLIVGNKGSERLLLDAAQEISNAFGGWVPPGNQ